MRTWKSGDLMAIAAGIVTVLAALLPWAVPATGRPSLIMWYEPALFVAAMVVGLALVVAGWRRTPWAGLVALVGTFVLAVALFDGAIPAHETGSRPGFGLFLVSGAALAAAVAGVLNAIERDEGDL